MSALRLIYLVLAVWGTVQPMRQVLAWFHVNEFDPAALLAAWFAGGPSAGLAWDMLISAIALSVWMIAETWVRRNWWALVALPATWLIGVPCGLPLYLFLRSRRVG